MSQSHERYHYESTVYSNKMEDGRMKDGRMEGTIIVVVVVIMGVKIAYSKFLVSILVNSYYYFFRTNSVFTLCIKTFKAK